MVVKKDTVDDVSDGNKLFVEYVNPLEETYVITLSRYRVKI